MILVFAIIVLFVKFGLDYREDLYFYDKNAKKSKYNWAILPFALAGIVLGLGTAVLISWIADPLIPSYKVVSENEICLSKSTDTDVETLTLNTEYLKRDLCFVVPVKDDNGETKDKYILASNTTFICDNSQSPKIIISWDKFQHQWVNLFVLDTRRFFVDYHDVTLILPQNIVINDCAVDIGTFKSKS